ncbi:MAG: hypothetical protein P4N59_03485 [Negativicutes bacterium]|nr:hypothetical protein [Negativicutes bacterium]
MGAVIYGGGRGALKAGIFIEQIRKAKEAGIKILVMCSTEDRAKELREKYGVDAMAAKSGGSTVTILTQRNWLMDEWTKHKTKEERLGVDPGFCSWD